MKKRKLEFHGRRFDDLPNELLQGCFLYLNYLDLFNFIFVSKKWHHMIMNNHIFYRSFLKDRTGEKNRDITLLREECIRIEEGQHLTNSQLKLHISYEVKKSEIFRVHIEYLNIDLATYGALGWKGIYLQIRSYKNTDHFSPDSIPFSKFYHKKKLLKHCWSSVPRGVTSLRNRTNLCELWKDYIFEKDGEPGQLLDFICQNFRKRGFICHTYHECNSNGYRICIYIRM